MAMVVKNNLSAKNTLNTLDRNSKALSKSLAKISSGMRINSAADDASGLAISERMTVQIRSLGQDEKNAQNGNSLLKTAEGAVGSTVEILRTLKEKAINVANDTNTDADRMTVQKELNQYVSQIDDNAHVTYNGKYLVDGSKNDKVLAPGTKTVLANESFSDDIEDYTLFTELVDATGRSLGIHDSDTLTVSYVKQGKTIVAEINPLSGKSFQDVLAAGNNDITLIGATNKVGKDKAGNDVYTVSGRKAMVYVANDPGLDGQIAGLTLSVKDRYGNVNKTANNILNNFQEVVRAENPSPDNALRIQIGTRASQSLRSAFTDMSAYALGLRSKTGEPLDISTQKKANAAIAVLDNALQKALDQQTTIGSLQTRLSAATANIIVSGENTQAAESVIRDADMAQEMTTYTKNNILTQGAQAMLAQANQNSSQALSLLQ